MEGSPSQQHNFEELFYAHRWEETPLGAVATWNDELRRWVKFILSAAQPMFIVWGPERVLVFNEPHSRNLGPRFREALGLPISVLWARVWDEIAPLLEHVYAGNSAWIEDKPLLTWESNFTEVRYFTVSYCPLQSLDDEVLGALCIVTDRTEVLRNKTSGEEERAFLRDLFERASSFIAVLEGPEHIYTVSNEACRHLFGSEDKFGKSVREAIPDLVGQGIIDIFDNVHRTGETFVGKAMPLRVGERTYSLDFTCQPMRRENKIIGVLVEGYDVTSHRDAQERILSLQTELIHLSRLGAMGNMAATLAHELNQPLTAISNYAVGLKSLLKRQGVMDALQPLEEIEQNAQRAGRIIRSLRNMTAASGPHQEVFDPEKVINEAVSFVRVGGCDVPIKLNFGDSAQVYADPIQIQQVVVNLVKNACEAVAGVKDPRVIVSTSLRDDEVEVRVSDNGPGISEEVEKRLFTSFNTSKAEGMGMGLSISRTIIEAHQGKIWGHNVPGGGAEFGFTLPRA